MVMNIILYDLSFGSYRCAQKLKKLPLRSEVKDDTTMRDDKDFLSYKTYVYNFFNSSNFFNFTQVEPAKLELYEKFVDNYMEIIC